MLLLSFQPSQAQRRRASRKARTTQVKKNTHNEMFDLMLDATAKVMFIDSVVVPKSHFLETLPDISNLGKIKIHDTDGASLPLILYENELGDRRIYSDGDSTNTVLYAQNLLGNKWSKGEQLEEISSETYPFQNFPFLMSDGITLYFSATGKQCVGKRDIFMTTYDADKGTYYEPQNCGLPFNSVYNDYLLAIDDIDSLGWLVTDRFQPKDSVCIYTFVPTATRVDFQSDEITHKQLESYARLNSIRDTWRFGNRWKALKRRDDLVARIKNASRQQGEGLVINDQTIAYSDKDLKNPESRRLYLQLQEVKGMVGQTQKQLDNWRQQWGHNSSDNLRQQILQVEDQLEQQYEDIRMLTRKIRNLENQ
jgi:hypothetical protein